ncbi:MAG TPA: SRPBCC family protein [Streptosporangiaceae bacterium]|nr:SRPBCC family protein [Streptosporangiaceae bacterium]
MEWTGARYADKPTVEVRTWINAPPARVWQLVSDVELMPAMSSELQSVQWLDGASGPALGAGFAGRSKHEALGEWATTSHVVEFEPERVFGWAVEDPANPTALWRFRLEPKDGGTELSEWMQMGPGRSGLSLAIDRIPDKEQKIVFVRMREFEHNMTATLEQIKKLAEAGALWTHWGVAIQPEVGLAGAGRRLAACEMARWLWICLSAGVRCAGRGGSSPCYGGTVAGGSQGPSVNSRVRASSASMLHLAVVDR